ncbi:MAG: hypothetical protein R2792_04455 [Saprospiraceae bacterium]
MLISLPAMPSINSVPANLPRLFSANQPTASTATQSTAPSTVPMPKTLTSKGELLIYNHSGNKIAQFPVGIAPGEIVFIQ